MAVDIKSLALRVCDDVNSFGDNTSLLASIADTEGYIEIEFFCRDNHHSIGDIVYLRLSSFARSHLVFVSGDDSSNTSLWRIV